MILRYKYRDDDGSIVSAMFRHLGGNKEDAVRALRDWFGTCPDGLDVQIVEIDGQKE